VKKAGALIQQAMFGQPISLKNQLKRESSNDSDDKYTPVKNDEHKNAVPAAVASIRRQNDHRTIIELQKRAVSQPDLPPKKEVKKSIFKNSKNTAVGQE
jgi:hypothetical protein